jgi:murein DD-endopeptidase MepM/ murein hydrolase activator NlpD
MPAKLWKRFLIVAFLLGAQAFMAPFAPAQVVHAQQGETFSIITPYYGSKPIRSFFDHSAPNYVSNNIFVRYDGRQFTGNVALDTCTTDVNNFPGSTNCYDGHNGLDVAMSYEQVLAVADGVVWWAKWAVINCHNGAGCSYGLEVKIKHTVNGQTYSTRYGHLTTLAVQEGQFVKAGQIIGTSGSTGASTGPHLH